MPQSKNVNVAFQQALRDAIQCFRNAKQPLWNHHYEQIAAMEAVVNNNHQTNRELRNNARRVCNEINASWRNWLVKSLLTTNIEAVLNDPRFNVERLYEGMIDHQGEVIRVQAEQIEDLTLENQRLENNFPACYQEVKKRLADTETALSQATEQLKRSDDQLKQGQQLLTVLNDKLEDREKNYQLLLHQYMQTFENKTIAVPTKNSFTLPPQVAPRSSVTARRNLNVAKGVNLNTTCNTDVATAFKSPVVAAVR